MPYQPQRFIHAANVRLDVPVSVYLSEQLTDDLRHQLEDATLLAFDCVVDNCVERNVDYLLLSGNLFVETDRSLRARLALLRAFRRLRAEGIPVYVLPGDADPPEAWRAIPRLPDNVHVCFSSSPEPFNVKRGKRTIATVSASMWYGETDAFGIRVIHSSPDGIEPFRIGTVSRARYDESRRMASLTAAAEDNLISLHDDDHDQPAQDPQDEPDAAEQSAAEYEAGFRTYIQKLMREGRLNYLAFGSQLLRTEMQLDTGLVHCPGTTQPRSQLEADCGLCSLVTVDSFGKASSEEINTSAVDWKNITLQLDPGTELNQLLEQMRDILVETPSNPSDRIWSVCWTLTGPLPLLRNFVEDDLELAVAVELDALDFEGRPVRLLHQIRTLPDPWDLDDRQHLAQQYAELIPQDGETRRNVLRTLLDESELSEGWSKRLEALADGIDAHRLLAQLRNDGADWFVADLDELMPAEVPEQETAETAAADAEPGDADTDVEAESSSEEDASTIAVLTADDDDDDDHYDREQNTPNS
ncbi:MAG: hypothetical protein ABGZ35_26505 [Planctomycetaceae bacterium]